MGRGILLEVREGLCLGVRHTAIPVERGAAARGRAALRENAVLAASACGKRVGITGYGKVRVTYARRMGQPTQRATNYTARSNIDTAQIFLHANGQIAP